MAKYRVKEKSFIDNKLFEAGDEVEYDGVPGKNLEPLDQDGKKAAGKRSEADKESAKRMKDAAAGADLNDKDYAPGQAAAPAGA